MNTIKMGHSVSTIRLKPSFELDNYLLSGQLADMFLSLCLFSRRLNQSLVNLIQLLLHLVLVILSLLHLTHTHSCVLGLGNGISLARTNSKAMQSSLRYGLLGRDDISTC